MTLRLIKEIQLSKQITQSRIENDSLERKEIIKRTRKEKEFFNGLIRVKSNGSFVISKDKKYIFQQKFTYSAEKKEKARLQHCVYVHSTYKPFPQGRYPSLNFYSKIYNFKM